MNSMKLEGALKRLVNESETNVKSCISEKEPFKIERRKAEEIMTTEN